MGRKDGKLWRRKWDSCQYSKSMKWCLIILVGEHRRLFRMVIIVCACGVVQLMASMVRACLTRALISSSTKGGNMITFVCDLVLLYSLIAATTAAANTQSLQSEWRNCSSKPSHTYCRNARACIAMSFGASVVLVLTALYPVCPGLPKRTPFRVFWRMDVFWTCDVRTFKVRHVWRTEVNLGPKGVNRNFLMAGNFSDC